jgi:hypothetical protein
LVVVCLLRTDRIANKCLQGSCMDKIPYPKMWTKKFIFCHCKFQGGNPPSPPVAIGDHNKKTTNVFFSLHCCCHCGEEFESLFADDDGVSAKGISSRCTQNQTLVSQYNPPVVVHF